jgi:glycosyltransferase involved in cell wall biosynthesis
MEKELKETSNALGLSGHINFVGLVADISSYLASADVIVIPSVWQEPAGLLVIESMACGRPVVATRVGGIPEYLTDAETGVLVDPKRPDLISAAVLNLLRSPELSTRLGSAARKHVEEKFTTEKWVENTLQLYGPEFQASESILRKSSDVSAVSSN